MIKRTRTQLSSLALAAACLSALPLVVACNMPTDEATQVGTVTMNLVSTSVEGNTYRLNGVFAITQGGFAVTTLDTATDPDATTLSTDLDAGSYVVALEGWSMQVLENGIYVPINADALSPLTQSFDVVAGQTSNVVYQFKVFGETVSLGGSLAINTEIVEESCDDDVAEDNDSFAEAAPIQSLYTYDAAICPLDNDYFQFTAEVGQPVSVRLSLANVDGDLDVVVYDENMLQLGESNSVNDQEEVNISSFPTTVGYVFVSGFQGAANTYELFIGSSPSAWTCPSAYYTDADCDCGCGVEDPSCEEITTVDQCDYNNCPAGTVVNPEDFTQCL